MTGTIWKLTYVRIGAGNYCPRNFRHRNFRRQNFCRTEFSPNGIFAEGIFRWTDYSLNTNFAERIFHRQISQRTNFSPKTSLKCSFQSFDGVNSVTVQFFLINYSKIHMVTYSNKKYKSSLRCTLDNVIRNIWFHYLIPYTINAKKSEVITHDNEEWKGHLIVTRIN